MSADYRLSPLAEADLEDIWRYTFENWSSDQADRYIRNLIEAFEDLAARRRPGRSAQDIRDGYLKQLVGSHVIYFRRRDDGIDVIRILHGRMDVARHL
jgi:toxin ParE1/3/4